MNRSNKKLSNNNTDLITMIILVSLIASGLLIGLIYDLARDNTVVVYVTKTPNTTTTTTGTTPVTTTGTTPVTTTGTTPVTTTGTTSVTTTGTTSVTTTGTTPVTTTGTTPVTTTGTPTTTPTPLPAETNATFVYGQEDLFSNNVPNPPNARSLNSNYGIAIDPYNNINLYVADAFNNRVLYYEGLNTTAVRVYGQLGSFITRTPNIGGIGVNTLVNPFSMFATCRGLYIGDTGNNRVFYYDRDSTTPSFIYGQASDIFSSANGGLGSPYRMSFSMITEIFVDNQDNLYVADQNNNRVLRFPFNSNIADRVWGQSGNFNSATSGCSSTQLNQPSGVFVDTDLNVYIADTSNHRVLKYASGSTTASIVYGQSDFVSCSANRGLGSPNEFTLNGPTGVFSDGNGVYVADGSNNRVLYYPSNETSGLPGVNVYGQDGVYTTNTVNNPGGTPTPANLNQPDAVLTNSNNDLYISDRDNQRVLFFPSTSPNGYSNQCSSFTTSTTTTIAITTTTPTMPSLPSTTATGIYGQADFVSDFLSPITPNSLNGPHDVYLDINENVYIADTFNSRVLFYETGNTTAARVYGQLGSFNVGTSNTGGRSEETLSNPQGVFATSFGVYIADGGNNRVLYFEGTSTTPSLIYGQVGTTIGIANGGATLGRSNLSGPTKVYVDRFNRLYVADSGNNRIVRFPSNSNIAEKVWGQSTFYTSSSGCSASNLNNPRGMYVDYDFNLYVADQNNNRVLKFEDNSTTATIVFGQADFTSCNVNRGNPSPSADSLYSPEDVTLDDYGIYITEEMNQRVVYYPFGSINATQVWGQLGDFTTNTINKPGGTPTANNLYFPKACHKTFNKLYCADSLNSRVLVYE